MAQKRAPLPARSVTSLGVEQGKVPPQAPDLEEAVLGAVMLEKDAILQVIDILKPKLLPRPAPENLPGHH